MAVDVTVHAGGHHEGITTDTALVNDNVVNAVSNLVQTAKQGLRLVVVIGAPDYVAGLDEIQSVLNGTIFWIRRLFL